MGTMRILDRTGDTAIAWSLEDPASIVTADALFAQLRAEHKIPFARAVGAPASDAERIHTFDPAAEEIVWVRPVAGG